MTDGTTYTRSQVVEWLVGGEDMPIAHSSLYVALHDGIPGDNAQNNEIDLAGYSRVQTSTPEDWETDGTGVFENTSDILFDEATQDWGEVTHFSLWDGPDDTDNSLAKSELEQPISINDGDSPVFRKGRLTGSFL